MKDFAELTISKEHDIRKYFNINRSTFHLLVISSTIFFTHAETVNDEDALLSERMWLYRTVYAKKVTVGNNIQHFQIIVF